MAERTREWQAHSVNDIEEGAPAVATSGPFWQESPALGSTAVAGDAPSLRMRKKLNVLETERDRAGWSTQTGTQAKNKTARKKGNTRDQYDIFLSYRVDADQKLVEDLYWRLEGMSLTANGAKRKLRLFWDKKCLRAGESWEAGFSRAILSSTVVIAVMSREALARVATLKSDSPCDNVVLEYALSLSLAEMKNTAIFPLFVGDRVKNDDAGLEQQIKSLKEQIKASVTFEQDSSDLQDMKALLTDMKKRYTSLDERYTHYFKSGCHPTSPDVSVLEIDEKWAKYVSEAKEGLSCDVDMRPRTVKEIMSGMTQRQGHFLMGTASDAMDGALDAIYKCAQRVIEEQESSRLVEVLQFSTPQGQEVLEWLAEEMVSQYSHVFARNKLDSLSKVSRLSETEISQINEEFCRGLHGTAQIGGRIRLAGAVASLKNDPRTRSIANRLSSLNDSVAENATLNQRFEWILSFVVFLAFATVFAFSLPIMGLPLHIALVSRPHSVTSYTVQLSVDRSNWTNVMCPGERREGEVEGQKCVFDALTEQSIGVTHWFPRTEVGRYLRLLPRSWENMHDGTGADLRLGIMSGSPEEGSSLAFAVDQGGVPGQAWLQAGCNKHGPHAPAGVWLSVEEKSGLVQCCLNMTGVHVCTRDGCLARGSGAAVKVSWREAKAECESRGWRLCSRQELDRKGSSGCCGSELAGANQCGYDSELVWTATTGGKGPHDSLGRLHSDIAFENARLVEVDLLGLRRVDGLTVQGGVAGERYRGLACVYWMWGAFVLPCVLLLLVQMVQLFVGLTTPWAMAVSNLGEPMAFFLPAALGAVLIMMDPSVPSPWSANPVCLVYGPRVSGVFVTAWAGMAQRVWWVGWRTLCPQIPKDYVFMPVDQLCWAIMILSLIGHARDDGPLGTIVICFRYVAYWFLAAPFIWFIPKTYLFNRQCKAQARKKICKDVEKYEMAWEAAGGANGQRAVSVSAVPGSVSNSIRVGPRCFGDTNSLLKSIKKKCSDASGRINEERTEIVARMSLVDRLLFWIGAGPRSWQHKSRYARTGKYRQRSRNVDRLFDEAATLNDHFLSLISEKIASETGSRTGSRSMIGGPVKRPDRALQKTMRKYFMDPRCLTDLVRCCILLPSIEDVDHCLEVILGLSVIGSPEISFEEIPIQNSQGRSIMEIENQALEGKIFKLVKVKDRFTDFQQSGYRDICLNVEVAWTISSESDDVLDFLPVYDSQGRSWDSIPHIRTHICEIQLLLESMYTLKATGCHENFVAARNILAQ